MARFKLGQYVKVVSFNDNIGAPLYNDTMIKNFKNKVFRIRAIEERETSYWYRFVGVPNYVFDESWLMSSDSEKYVKKIKYPIDWLQVISKGYGKI